MKFGDIMNNVLLTLLLIMMLGFVFYVLIKSIIEYRLILKMKAKEKKLRNIGVYPSGSSLSHGMCVNRSTGKIEHDQIESISWYKRLAD